MQLWTDPLPDESMGGLLQMRAEVNFPNLVEDAVLLEDLALNDLSGLCGELGLSAGDQSLPVKEEQVDGLTWMKEHLDRDPVGQPTDGGSYEGRSEKDYGGCGHGKVVGRGCIPQVNA